VASLDRYLKPLVDNRAEELHIYANVPPTYLLDQTPIKEIDKLFTNDDLVDLLKEIASPEEIEELNEKRRLNHHYQSPVLGQFRCQARWSKGDLKIRFTHVKDEAPEATPPGPSRDLEIPKPPQSQTHMSQAHLSQANMSQSQLSAAKAPSPASNTSLPSPTGELPPFPGNAGGPPTVQGKAFTGVDAHTPARPQRVQTQTSALDEEEDMFAPFLKKKRKTPEIDRLLRILIDEGGSDLHISSKEKPMIRVDGSMRRLDTLPVLQSKQVMKLLAPIIPGRNRLEFTKTWDTDFAYEIEEVARFRSNIFMDRHGVGAVFRQIPSKIITAEQLGLPKALTDLCYLSKGLVLVTGPTGSGKSTTLCALIDLINRSRDDHIITIEDPIEFVHPNKRCLVNQREVGVHTKSFKAALRAALREDPDIILVGELRDLETISIAIETAETGHLVFGTLHTSSAVSTVDRIIDQFPGDQQEQIRAMLSESLKAVISQTLLKRRGGGRIAAMEILLVTHGVSNQIRERKTYQLNSVMQTSRAMGMQCLNDILMEYVARGIVDLLEAYTKSIDKKNFIDMCEKNGINTSQITSGGLIGMDAH